MLVLLSGKYAVELVAKVIRRPVEATESFKRVGQAHRERNLAEQREGTLVQDLNSYEMRSNSTWARGLHMLHILAKRPCRTTSAWWTDAKPKWPLMTRTSQSMRRKPVFPVSMTTNHTFPNACTTRTSSTGLWALRHGMFSPSERVSLASRALGYRHRPVHRGVLYP